MDQTPLTARLGLPTQQIAPNVQPGNLRPIVNEHLLPLVQYPRDLTNTTRHGRTIDSLAKNQPGNLPTP